MQMFADYHTHTCYSHGAGTVFDNVKAAKERGLQEIAIADHGPANLFGVGVRDLDTFARLRRDVEVANVRFAGVRVLLAVEANVIATDGRLDIPLPMQNSFDLVLAGLHMLVRPCSWWSAAQVAAVNMLARMNERNVRRALVANTDLLVQAVYRNKIDIITHPGYRLPIDTQELAKACVLNGTAMEINTSHMHTSVQYLRRAAQEGVRFAIGSDAHDPGRVGDLQAGCDLAAEAGIGPEQIINAYSQGRDQNEGRESLYRWRRRRKTPCAVTEPLR